MPVALYDFFFLIWIFNLHTQRHVSAENYKEIVGTGHVFVITNGGQACSPHSIKQDKVYCAGVGLGCLGISNDKICIFNLHTHRHVFAENYKEIVCIGHVFVITNGGQACSPHSIKQEKVYCATFGLGCLGIVNEKDMDIQPAHTQTCL